MTEPAIEPSSADARTGLTAHALLRKHAALVATVLLFLCGAYALYHLLAPLNMRVVLHQIRATPLHIVFGAMLATVVGYTALIGYDWTALRYIGKRVPLPTVALGGFLGYAFGNTIGLSPVSGGAIRYRIYSALGLDAYDVAAVATFASISYGIGATLVGLIALAVHPTALEGVTAIAPHTLRLGAIAGAALVALLLVLLGLKTGNVQLGRYSLHMPGFGSIASQIIFTFTDICMAALVLHLLLPTGSLPFANMLAVFAVATLVGVASHVPGGVGVFESVVIAALPASVPLNDAVTALLLFRLIYFLLPFLLALALLSLSEAISMSSRAAPAMAGLAPVLRAGRGAIPMATGALVLASGLFMMFAGVLPNRTATYEELEPFLPLAMITGGPMVSSILGVFLAVLSVSVFRRSRTAFWLVLGGLAAGAVLAAFKTDDPERVLLLVVMALILWPCRREFYRDARLTQGVLSVQWVVFSLAIIACLTLTWYLVHEATAARDMMWWHVTGDEPAVVAWRTALTGSVLLSAVLIFTALRTARTEIRLPTEDEITRAAAILDTYGAGSDRIALTGDKMLMFGPAGESVLSYGIKGASWIAMGGPVGTERDCEELCWAFHDAARAAGARPVFYEVPPAFAELAIEMGLSLHKMGEEAIVPLETFTLEGPERKKLRTTHNRALRDGLTLDLISPPHSTTLLAELRAISDTWLDAHAAREKRFSVGRFDPDWLNRTRVALVRLNGAPVAFANLMEAGGTTAIDLMRYGAEAPSGTMEYLFTELMLQLRAEGAKDFSLGMVPFAGMPNRKGASLWARFGSVVYAQGDRFYNFDGLHKFKNKFDPTWRPRYLACRSALPPVGPLSDAARLIAGSARGIIGK